ncbi:hypothetical protein T4C_14164 [Trichinella pseudospiralis]|uniref:Uncharacterized protein n=1 Tax=Trichinella pseudospiralis TaxID=6337 RepID=A0A0V1KA13_TRIPS|nr:hypothetical protein T4C_14164 [Trichinella pseudospiralis]
MIQVMKNCGKLGATGLYFHQRFISGVVQKYQTNDGVSTITMKARPKISSHRNFPKLIKKTYFNKKNYVRAASSIGRAPALHAGGTGIDTPAPTEMGSVFNVVNLSVINNTVDGSDVRMDAWIFWGTWLLRKCDIH